MLINIFEEVSWENFIQIEKYKNLPLNEQEAYYKQYIQDLEIARQNWLAYQNKGTRNRAVGCARGMDVIFLLDYSGSMDNIIESLKTSIANIVQTIITESNGDYRLGLMLFDEYEVGVTVNYTNKPLYTNLPASRRLQLPGVGNNDGPIIMYITGLVELATQNENDFTDVLNKLNTTLYFPMQPGTGAPEPGDVGYEELLDGMVGTFRNDVSKIVILISDALPGGGNETYDPTTIASLEASKTESIAEDIQVYYFDVNSSAVTRNEDEGYRILSDNTRGLFTQSPTADATEIITGIQTICEESA